MKKASNNTAESPVLLASFAFVAVARMDRALTVRAFLPRIARRRLVVQVHPATPFQQKPSSDSGTTSTRGAQSVGRKLTDCMESHVSALAEESRAKSLTSRLPVRNESVRFP